MDNLESDEQNFEYNCCDSACSQCSTQRAGLMHSYRLISSSDKACGSVLNSDKDMGCLPFSQKIRKFRL